MLGAVVYRLRALSSDSIPVAHGHLMHGVCFQLLQDFSPLLSHSLHSMEFKPFTASMLSMPPKLRPKNSRWIVEEGALLRWRVTALQDEVLRAFLMVTKGFVLHVGNLALCVEEIVADAELEPRTGVMHEEELINICWQTGEIKTLQMEFLSVTSFRSGNKDFIWPAPDFVFGSLADKWEAIHPNGTTFAKEIRDMAGDLSLENWSGHSQRVYIQHNRGIQGFVGTFKFGLESLSMDWRRYFLLLASFGEFSGIGRLTAQGFGQTRASWG